MEKEQLEVEASKYLDGKCDITDDYLVPTMSDPSANMYLSDVLVGFIAHIEAATKNTSPNTSEPVDKASTQICPQCSGKGGFETITGRSECHACDGTGQTSAH